MRPQGHVEAAELLLERANEAHDTGEVMDAELYTRRAEAHLHAAAARSALFEIGGGL